MSYQPPTSTGGANQYAATGQNVYEDTSRPVQYRCGDCNAKVVLRRGDLIRCKDCGFRVLYKERTNRYVERDASLFASGGRRGKRVGDLDEGGSKSKRRDEGYGAMAGCGDVVGALADCFSYRMVQFEAR